MRLIRRLFPVLTFLPIVIGVAVLFVPAGGASEAGPPSTDILVSEDPEVRPTSATIPTSRPSASAFAMLLLPSYKPIITFRPESFRFSAWACPWLP